MRAHARFSFHLNRLKKRLYGIYLGGDNDFFDHEKLDVYQAAIEFVVLIDTVVENLPRVTGTHSLNAHKNGQNLKFNLKKRARARTRARSRWAHTFI